MSAREFDEHLENEGWMEEEDDANESLTLGKKVLINSLGVVTIKLCTYRNFREYKVPFVIAFRVVKW